MMQKEKSYKLTQATTPPYEKSDFITEAVFEQYRFHQGIGDMWPVTWGDDGHLYAAAGDNRQSPLNFWRVRGEPSMIYNNEDAYYLDIINDFPIDPVKFCRRPDVHPTMGMKPAGLIDRKGCMYMAVELMNYGTDPDFRRQENVCGFIITSRDYGVTWNETATPTDFFTGRLSSIHFVQYGTAGYREPPDNFVYATFPCGHDGKSYWENGDCMLLGRVWCDHIIDRDRWEFYIGMDETGNPIWSQDDSKAVEIFTYPSMCGENHVSYNKGIGRYILGNYSFLDDAGNPIPNHQGHWPENALRSQLALYESEHLWGPWKLFYQDDNWGTYGDYQPVFPPKWMYNSGRTMFMVSSGTNDDYNFTVQRLDIKTINDIQENKKYTGK